MAEIKGIIYGGSTATFANQKNLVMKQAKLAEKKDVLEPLDF